MGVQVFRIDDRLIHGQIVTAWLQYADAEKIVVVDNDAATNELRKRLLRMATPKTTELEILTVEEAQEKLPVENVKTLLLVGSPIVANQIVDFINLKKINVGNQNMKKGKSKILDNFWLFDDDVKAFDSLRDKGIECEFRTVPSDKSLNVYEIIERNRR